MIFSLSAKSRNALLKYLQIYLDFCLDAPPEAFHSICYTSCIGRELYRHRFTCVVKDLDNLVQRLKDQILHGYFSASFPSNSRLVFAFPGQGSQFYGMAKTLATTFPVFREILTDAANTATSEAGFDVLSYLVGSDQEVDSDTINKSAVSQICVSISPHGIS
jgi:acyl transferase domain-containing protein